METSPEFPRVFRAFGLGPDCESRYLSEGLMNRNWRIDTGEGPFALKELRDVTAATARRNLAVLAPLAAAGLPVPIAVTAADGDPVVEHGGRAFYLMPWLEGARIPGTELTMGQVEDLGALLGRLHLQLNEPSLGLPRDEPVSFPAVTASEARAKLERFLDVIERRESQSAFDEAAVEALRQRRVLLDAHGGSRPNGAVADRLSGWVHGDFHSTNLLWHGGRVAGILDWDRLQVRPFGEEVARAAVLHFKSDDGRMDLERVAVFMKGYRGVIAISASAMADAAHRLWWHHLTGFWIFGLHYDRAVFNCDYLLEPRERLIRWWAGHLDEVGSAFTAGAS